MEGFISVAQTKFGKITRDMYGNLKIEKGCAHSVATFFQKLKIDKENDVYVDEHMGAVVGNVDVFVKSIDELEKYNDKKTKINPYQKYLDMRDKGYNLVIGTPFPAEHGGAGRNQRGVYCKNYLEMVEKEKQTSSEYNF